MSGEVRVFGAAEHHLRDVEVTFRPGLTALVGVSGSGKSGRVLMTVTLVLTPELEKRIVAQAMAQRLSGQASLGR